jgi:Flp pilus assembly protein TadG
VRRTTGKRGEKGTALVEFALALPFVAIIALGTLDLGRAYQLQNRLKNAAREGAAYVQMSPGSIDSSGTCADPDNVTYRALHEDANSAGWTVTVTNTDTNTPVTGCAATGAAPGTHLKVSVQSNMTILTPLVSALTGRTKAIHGTAEVVVQG